MNAVLDPTATIGAGTTYGEGCVFGPGVRIGPGCVIGHHVVLHAGTVIGNQVRIDDHASLGKTPMRAANSAVTREQALPPLTVGDHCIVGTGAVLYRGAAIDAKVLLADLCTVRENVTIGRGTIVGRGVTIENVCTIGPAKNRSTSMMADVYTRIHPGWNACCPATPSMMAVIQPSVPISVVASGIMMMIKKIPLSCFIRFI